jgi:hypothetical protein
MSDFAGDIELDTFENNIIYNETQYNNSNIKHTVQDDEQAVGYSSYQVLITLTAVSMTLISIITVIRCCFCNNSGYTAIPESREGDVEYGGFIYREK